MEDMELICLQIISNAGEARSESMAALAAARNSRFDEAGEHLAAAGGERWKEAHHVHTRLITMDASGELDKIGLIMIHSEDIMIGGLKSHWLWQRKWWRCIKAELKIGEGYEYEDKEAMLRGVLDFGGWWLWLAAQKAG